MKKILFYYLRNFPIDIGKKRLASLLSFENQNKKFVFTNKEGLKFAKFIDYHDKFKKIKQLE